MYSARDKVRRLAVPNSMGSGPPLPCTLCSPLLFHQYRLTLRVSPLWFLQCSLLCIVASNMRDDCVGAFCKHRRFMKVVGASEFNLQTYLLQKCSDKTVEFFSFGKIWHPRTCRPEPVHKICDAFPCVLSQRGQFVASTMAIIFRSELFSYNSGEVVPCSWSTSRFACFPPP